MRWLWVRILAATTTIGEERARWVWLRIVTSRGTQRRVGRWEPFVEPLWWIRRHSSGEETVFKGHRMGERLMIVQHPSRPVSVDWVTINGEVLHFHGPLNLHPGDQFAVERNVVEVPS